ncbi:hypothetical protein EVAR_97950_1 [Eumeta japonica]|uniref:Uncharacterized protein n=1 Tax=Eumeta variegata TaxID=151549 RepID=A0A4C1XW23_EUMVA|nr:hypothetical protein EVAR_97950_1 [Eumeta japonica]
MGDSLWDHLGVGCNWTPTRIVSICPTRDKIIGLRWLIEDCRAEERIGIRFRDVEETLAIIGNSRSL